MLSDIIRDKIRAEIDSYDISLDIEESVSSIDMSEFDDQIRDKIIMAVNDVDVEEMVGDFIRSTINEMI
jgi:hypothetical protein